MVETRYTYAQAARRLGWSLRTFDLWRARAGVEGAMPAHFTNRRLVTEEQIDEIRRYRDEARAEAGIGTGPSPQRLEPILPRGPVVTRPLLPTRRERALSAAQPYPDALPAGWIAANRWAERHGVQARSWWRDYVEHAGGGVHGAQDGVRRWRGATGQGIAAALDPEQQRAAIAFMRVHWRVQFRPCDDGACCATSAIHDEAP